MYCKSVAAENTAGAPSAITFRNRFAEPEVVNGNQRFPAYDVEFNADATGAAIWYATTWSREFASDQEFAALSAAGVDAALKNRMSREPVVFVDEFCTWMPVMTPRPPEVAAADVTVSSAPSMSPAVYAVIDVVRPDAVTTIEVGCSVESAIRSTCPSHEATGIPDDRVRA